MPVVRAEGGDQARNRGGCIVVVARSANKKNEGIKRRKLKKKMKTSYAQQSLLDEAFYPTYQEWG